MAVQPVPQGYHALTPYLIINGAAAAVEFYKAAFGATERMRLDAPGGKLGHCELEIGGSVLMLADEAPGQNCRAPSSLGGTPVLLHLYVPDVDATLTRAVAAGAGAVVERPAEDMFYGDRNASIRDPFGHCWSLATHIEDVSPEEISRRMREKFGAG